MLSFLAEDSFAILSELIEKFFNWEGVSPFLVAELLQCPLKHAVEQRVEYAHYVLLQRLFCLAHQVGRVQH